MRRSDALPSDAPPSRAPASDARVSVVPVTGAMRPPRLLIAAGVPSTLTAFLLPFAERYRARGWRVDAAANGAPDDARVVAAFDAAHHVPWTRRPRDPVNLACAPRALRALVAREGYDLVHVHDPVPGFVVRWALRGARRRPGGPVVVYTAHGFHFFAGNGALRNAVFRTLERTAAPWTDHLVVINREDWAAARGWPVAGDVRYLPGIGIDLERYAPGAVSDRDAARVRAELDLTPGQPLLLIVAELNPGKRHADALAALAAAERPDAVLACAGVGPEEPALRARAAALGVADRVRWLGYRRDVPELLAASAALLLPSEREGLPRSVMEAMALERPVLACRVRGVVELVQDGATGWLTEVGDVAALAGAIRAVVDDPEAAAAMGRAGRAALAPFALERVLEAHDALYAQALAGRAGISGP